MRIEIHSTEAGHWHSLACEALEGVIDERDEIHEQARKRLIKRENRFRRWVPFVKPIPTDASWEEVKSLRGPMDDTCFSLRWWRDRFDILWDVFRALTDLLDGKVHAVNLNTEEINLIRRYTKCEP